MTQTTKLTFLRTSIYLKRILGEVDMKKEQLVREVVKLSLKHGAPIKAEDILKICLDESYKKNQIHKKEDCHVK